MYSYRRRHCQFRQYVLQHIVRLQHAGDAPKNLFRNAENIPGRLDPLFPQTGS